MPLSLPFSQLQAHVLIGFSDAFQSLVFFRITDPAAFKPLAMQLLDRLTWANRVTGARAAAAVAKLAGATLTNEPKPGKVALAFAYRGLTRLAPAAEMSWLALPRYQLQGQLEYYSGVNAASAFSQDCPARSNAVLMDPFESSSTWVVGKPAALADGVLVFAAPTREEEEAWRTATLESLSASIEVVHTDCGDKLAGNGEHFGFIDAMSHPYPDLSDSEDGDRPLQQVVGGTQPCAAGQLLLLPVASDPGGNEPPSMPSWVVNGAFLVYRRLNQDVGGFHQALAALATAKGATARAVAARALGRTTAGAPLVTGAVLPDKFDYDADTAGQQCPFSAHVRRANPRNARNPRPLFRRSVPFGRASASTFDAPQADDGAERGLLFLAYQASIERQFEYLSTHWLNQEDPKPIDALVGRRGGQPGLRDVELGLGATQLESYVNATGAGYFLALSRRGMVQLFT
jgi:Dyp-type peroxidase family